MDSDHALVLFLALVLVGAAVALAYASPLLLGGRSDGVADASLAEFETTEPYCGDSNQTTGSAVTRDVAGGEALVIDGQIPVSTNDTVVNASFDEFGPQQFVLDVTRTEPQNQTVTETATPTETTATEPNATPGVTTEQGTATAGPCYLVVGYNATIHLTRPREYTVLVTYDDELVSAYWRDGNETGSFNRLPERPRDGGNETATNASDRPRPARSIRDSGVARASD